MRMIQQNGFTITGDDLQVVEMALCKGEKVIADAGALMYMEQGICHEVIGDGHKKRWQYVNYNADVSRIAFSSPVPGRIVPVDLDQYNNKILSHGNAFLCSQKDSTIDITYQKSYEVSPHSGDLTIETISGKGYVFLKTSGPFMTKEIRQSEVLRVDSRCLIAMTKEISYDYQRVGEVYSFNEEKKDDEYVFITLSGPGTVWLQSAS